MKPGKAPASFSTAAISAVAVLDGLWSLALVACVVLIARHLRPASPAGFAWFVGLPVAGLVLSIAALFDRSPPWARAVAVAALTLALAIATRQIYAVPLGIALKAFRVWLGDRSI